MPGLFSEESRRTFLLLKFFFNVESVRLLSSTVWQEDGAAAAAAMLRAGIVWKGGGLKTGVADKVLFRPKSVPLATGSLRYWGGLFGAAWRWRGRFQEFPSQEVAQRRLSRQQKFTKRKAHGKEKSSAIGKRLTLRFLCVTGWPVFILLFFRTGIHFKKRRRPRIWQPKKEGMGLWKPEGDKKNTTPKGLGAEKGGEAMAAANRWVWHPRIPQEPSRGVFFFDRVKSVLSFISGRPQLPAKTPSSLFPFFVRIFFLRCSILRRSEPLVHFVIIYRRAMILMTFYTL